MRISSPEFSDGGPMPRVCGYKNGNRRPVLNISGVPSGCKSLAVILDDPDAMAAVGKVWVHWTVWNIRPETTLLDESLSGCSEGLTDFGESGYGGPAPPDKRHTYVFTLYALDSMLDLRADSDRAALESAIKNHVIEQTSLTGTYEP